MASPLEGKKRKPSKASISASWREFWNTPEGRLAINSLMAKYGVYSEVTATDPTSLAIHVGQRNVCAWIAEMCGMRPDVYVEERETHDRIEFETAQPMDYFRPR